jgi:hypothetical protein
VRSQQHAPRLADIKRTCTCTCLGCCVNCCYTQERERKERERAVRAKVAACAFARGYLGGIVKNVFQQLQDTGYFFDPVEREVRAGGQAGMHQHTVDRWGAGAPHVQLATRVSTAACCKCNPIYGRRFSESAE